MATKKELQERYKELYGEQPDESVTVKELTALIKGKEDETAPSEDVPSSDGNDSEADPDGEDKEDAENVEEPVNTPESVPEAQQQGEEGKSGEKKFVENPRLLKKVEGKKETSKKTYYYGELR